MVTVSLDRPAYVGGQLVVAQDEQTHQNPAGSCSHTKNSAGWNEHNRQW